LQKDRAIQYKNRLYKSESPDLDDYSQYEYNNENAADSLFNILKVNRSNIE